MWCDILGNTDFKVGNVPEVLLYYRKHGSQLSIERSEKQRELYNKARFEYAKQIGEEELHLVKELINTENNPTVNNFEKLINRIINFCRNREISENVILYIIKEIYNKLIKKNLSFYYVYIKTTRNIKKKFEDEVFLFLKSILPVEQTSQIYQFFRKVF